MRFKMWWGFLILLLCQGCTHVSVSESTWRKMTPLSFCKKQCAIQLQACQKTCTNNCSRCQYQAKEDALNRYNDYIALQRRQGKVVAREGKAFLDPLACTKWTCNCVQDERVCQATCQGQVKPFAVHPCCGLSSPPHVVWWQLSTLVKG